MRIKMMIDRPATNRVYWCGQVYDVPEELAERWLSEGVAEKVVTRRKIEKKVEEDQ